jgi:diguanylate cyclase (GGDEF)-like protein
MQSFILNETKRNLLLTASVMAMSIDGDKHEQLVLEKNKLNKYYKKVQHRFQAFIKQNANMKYFYTIIKDKNDKLYFVIDSDADGDVDWNGDGIVQDDEKDVPIGSPYSVDEKTTNSILQGFKKPEVLHEPYTDKWGTFLSAYAPIYNSKREVVGICGVDMEFSIIKMIKKKLLIDFLGMLVVIFFISLIIVRVITNPIYNLIKMMQYSEADSSHIKIENGPQEYKIIADNFNNIRREINLQKEKTNILYKITKLINYTGNDIDNVLNTSLEIILDITDSKKGIILLSKSSDNNLNIGISIGIHDLNGKNVIQEMYSKEFIKLSEDILTQIKRDKIFLRENKNLPKIIENIFEKTDCFVCVPMISKNLLIGLLFLDNDYDDKNLLNTIIDQISIIIENVSLINSSYFDFLTNIYCRKQLMVLLDKEIAIASRYNSPLSLLMVDIDHFKNINDNFGHLKGDRTLVKVASLLKENIRETDLVGRYGGEEFIIVAPGIEGENALLFAEKIRKRIMNEQILSDHTVTVSIGVANYKQGLTPKGLINQADVALYKAKEKRNMCFLYDNTLNLYKNGSLSLNK